MAPARVTLDQAVGEGPFRSPRKWNCGSARESGHWPAV